MKLSQFDFELPQEKIATELMPEINGHVQWRDECKLMVLHKDTGEIEHRQFKDIIDYFGKGDRFVLNDTKVFPAKLYGKKEKTGADIMVFLLRELNKEQRLWDVIVDPARKIRIGHKLYFGEDESMVAEVIDNTTSRGRTLRFLYDGPYDEFKAALFALNNQLTQVNTTRETDRQQIIELSAQATTFAAQLEGYARLDDLSSELRPELKALFPQVRSIGLSRVTETLSDTTLQRRFVVALVGTSPNKRLNPADRQKLQEWLQTRTAADSLVLIEK